ncbi:hypothetical protein Cgig2_013438 [Carnegiea gigantea]|uniref:RRM domain-containing protein n=1 Tax=Carnegiea gigantea TaxID=171969 RepID=A0A9Q1K7M8_9CARY|nr:hypothetical protein Cgig2_013438 [Carnegiea gigantea]
MAGLERERGRRREKERANRGNEKQGTERNFFVFVENTPQNLDQYGLKGIFQKVKIPVRRGGGNKGRMAFVRFWRKEEVVKSILKFNISIIKGYRIKVCMKRKEIPETLGRKKQKQENEVEVMNERFSQKEDQSIKIIQGEVNQEFVDWFDTSIVCTIHEPRDFQALASTQWLRQCVKIFSISKFKFLLTFDTLKHANDVLSNHEQRDQ